MRRNTACLALGFILAFASGAAGAVQAHQVETLPTGPGWTAGHVCISFAAAVNRSLHTHPAPPPKGANGSPLSAALKVVPADLRSHVELCTWNGSWFVAPRGWRERDANLGADGNSGWTFVAPGGSKHGWLIIGVVPACVSCMLGAADGYFPDAHRLYNAMYGHHPNVTLSPKPDSARNPTRCSSMVAYRSRGLDVRDQQYWLPPLKDAKQDGLIGITVALPPGQARMQKVMLASFWGGRPPQKRHCPTHGWGST